MKKILKTTITLALVAGVILFNCAFLGLLPRGVYIDGVSVGGLTRTAAVGEVRRNLEERLKSKELVICADQSVYTFRFPEFYYKDDLNRLTASIRRKGEYLSDTQIYLNGEEEVLASICSDVERAAVEPYAVFNKSGEPFTYFEGRAGVRLNAAKLKEDVRRSLNGDFSPIVAELVKVDFFQSLENVKRGTVKICSFTTYFDGSNLPRSSNIRLAASLINGTIVLPGESFSFNSTVGARTRSNGFLPAKIISGGRFVDGVGGGVCQVSTTLYNAAVLAGMEITEYHPHSLSVSYVAPSRDAMVSGSYFDLKFKNSSKTPVYVRMSANYSGVTCTFYGTDDGVKRTFISRKVGVIPPPEDDGADGEIIAEGREGTVSEGYLKEEKDGRVFTKLLRRDRYGAVGAVKGKTGDTEECRRED